MRTLLVAVIVVLAVVPALASLPGQPLDLGDSAFLQPGCRVGSRPTVTHLVHRSTASDEILTATTR